MPNYLRDFDLSASIPDPAKGIGAAVNTATTLNYMQVTAEKESRARQFRAKLAEYWKGQGMDDKRIDRIAQQAEMLELDPDAALRVFDTVKKQPLDDMALEKKKMEYAMDRLPMVQWDAEGKDWTAFKEHLKQPPFSFDPKIIDQMPAKFASPEEQEAYFTKAREAYTGYQEKITGYKPGTHIYKGGKKIGEVPKEEKPEYTPGKAMDAIRKAKNDLVKLTKGSTMSMALKAMIEMMNPRSPLLQVPDGTALDDQQLSESRQATEDYISYLEQFVPAGTRKGGTTGSSDFSDYETWKKGQGGSTPQPAAPEPALVPSEAAAAPVAPQAPAPAGTPTMPPQGPQPQIPSPNAMATPSAAQPPPANPMVTQQSPTPEQGLAAAQQEIEVLLQAFDAGKLDIQAVNRGMNDIAKQYGIYPQSLASVLQARGGRGPIGRTANRMGNAALTGATSGFGITRPFDPPTIGGSVR